MITRIIWITLSFVFAFDIAGVLDIEKFASQYVTFHGVTVKELLLIVLCYTNIIYYNMYRDKKGKQKYLFNSIMGSLGSPLIKISKDG